MTAFDPAALAALALREDFAMRSRRVMAWAAIETERPRRADRLLPAGWDRAVAMERARAALPGFDSAAAQGWLSAQLGLDFAASPARALGVAVGRIFPAGDDFARRRFDWAPPASDPAERTGIRAILVPTLGDVVALEAGDPRRCWSLSGDLDPLGWDEPALDDVLGGEAPQVAVCEDALSWLARLAIDEAGGIRAVLDHAPAIAVLDWRSPFVDRLLRRDGLTLIAESDGHAEQLERAIDAWRKRQVPRQRPEILVAEAVAA